MDDLRQMHQIISTGKYILHHDYVFDKDGNLVTLASLKTNSYSTSRSEDLILRIDTKTGKILNDYKKTTKRPASTTNSEGVYGLDWMHINAIQYLGDETYVLSSRETSTIIKISNLFESSPNLDYLIGPKSLWKDTSYSSKVLKKIAVPYSSHVSSVQKKDGNIIVDSGFQGLFGEYSKSGKLLQQYKIKLNKYMGYRVYKYDFNGFYFNK